MFSTEENLCFSLFSPWMRFRRWRYSASTIDNSQLR